MKKAVWLTDLHLVFLRDKASLEFDPEYHDFLDSVGNSDADMIMISGDIGEAPDNPTLLTGLAEAWQKPIYFVLGNHDFYHSSIASVRKDIAELSKETHHLHYLSNIGPVSLTSETGLVGHDGWYDGRSGNYVCCDFRTNDFTAIRELRFSELRYTRPEADDLRRPILEQLADEGATHLRTNLRLAKSSFRKMYVVTHFPPFVESAFRRGRILDEFSSPLAVCTAIGEVLLEAARSAPECEFTVLCGHMHESCIYQPRENLRVLTGSAKYCSPEIQQVFMI